jgi:hypothetical protein
MDMPRVFRPRTQGVARIVVGALAAGSASVAAPIAALIAAPPIAALIAAPPIAALSIASVLVPTAAAALELPNLSGKWYLNKDASDSPDAATRDSDGFGSSSGSGNRGGGRGHGGRHGHSAAPSGDGRVSEDGSPLRDAFQRTQVLEIKHEEPRLSVTDAGGRERVFYTDGRKVEEEHSYGGTTKVTARWKDGHVEITSTPEKGPKVTETYAVTADHSQLTVTTTFQGGRRDVTIRRVYITTPPEQLAPQPAPGKSQPAPESDPADDAVV